MRANSAPARRCAGWRSGWPRSAIFSSYYESDAIGPIADLLLRQRGFTQLQIGDLTAVISLPNIFLALFNGLLIDRYGPARVTLWAAAIGFVGAVLTAIGTPYELMWAGRFVFGISEGAIFISLVAGVAQWFSRSGIALAAALFLSLARVGSYSLDKSPTWARSLYEAGWQPPLWLGAAITGAGLVAAIGFVRAGPHAAACRGVVRPRTERFSWAALWSFDLLLLVHPRPARAVCGRVLPVSPDVRDRVPAARQGPEPAAGRQRQLRRLCHRGVRHAAVWPAGGPASGIAR